MNILAASLAFAFALPPQENPKPDITWNLKAGETVRYEVEKETLIHGKMGTVEMKMKLGLVLEAAARDAEGKLPLKITIDRVVMTGKDSKENESYDSDRDKEAPKHPSIHLVAGCVNGKFEARLSRQGALSDYRGLNEIFEKAADNVPAIKASGDKDVAARFTSSIDQVLQEAFCLVPGKALAKGDTWDSSPGASTYGVGEAPFVIKSTVKEVRPGEAVLSRTVTCDFTKDARNPDGKATGKGEVIWSTERGAPVSGEWRMHVSTTRGESDVTFVLKLAPREKK